MLRVRGLAKRFGSLRALDGVDLDVAEGSLTGLIGPNGAGKTTAFGCIAGATKPSAGSITFRGREIAGTAYHRVAALGIARTYQVVQTFADMTVLEATTTGALLRHARLREAVAHAEEVLAFVGLTEKRYRLGRALTIADKKRLEVARALLMRPSLLMLDEPSLGIAPKLIPQIYGGIKAIAAAGTTVLLVEQNVREALRAADTAYVLQTGRVVLHGPANDLIGDPLVQEAFLGIGAA